MPCTLYSESVADWLGTISMVAELFAWIGVALGLVLLAGGAVRALAVRRWRTLPGVVVDADDESIAFRWFDDDGIQEGRVPAEHGSSVAVGDHVSVHVAPGRPGSARIDPVDHLGRALRVSGWLVLGVGVLAGLVSLVLLFA